MTEATKQAAIDAVSSEANQAFDWLMGDILHKWQQYCQGVVIPEYIRQLEGFAEAYLHWQQLPGSFLHGRYGVLHVVELDEAIAAIKLTNRNRGVSER